MLKKFIYLLIILIMLISAITCKKDTTTTTDTETEIDSGSETTTTTIKDIDMKKFNKDLKVDLSKLEAMQVIELEKNLDISTSTVNYFDVKEVDNSKMAIAEDDTPLTIVDYGPEGELSSKVHNPTIFVLFSQPIIPLAKLGEPMTSSEIMKIEPPIKGVFRWHGTKMLSFIPDERYTPQNIYTITVSDATSLGGKPLEKPVTFKFNTEYLGIQSYSPSGSDIPLDKAKEITITFKYPVDLDVIKDYITITSKGSTFGYKIVRPEKKPHLTDEYISKTVLLKMLTTFDENSKVEITLKKGARSKREYIGTKDDTTEFFRTIEPFKYRNHYNYSYSFPKSSKGDSNPVYLYFSHPVDKKSVTGNIGVSLNIGNPADYIEVWDNAVRISNLPVTFDSTYQVFIKSGIKDIYGRQLGIQKTVDVTVEGAKRYSYFPNQGTKILEAQFSPPKIAYEYQNVFDGRWKAQTIDNPYGRKFSNEELGPYDFKNLERNVKRYEALNLTPWLNSSGKGFVHFAWNFDKKELPSKLYINDYDATIRRIPSDGIVNDFKSIYYKNNNNDYYRLSYSYDLNAAKKRVIEYLTEQDDPVLYQPEWGKRDLLLQVTDLAVTARVAYNKVVILVSSLKTGLPIKNATVHLVEYKTNTTKLTGKTNKEGLAVFELNDNYRSIVGEYSYPKIRVEKDDDKVEFYPNSSHNNYHFGIYNTTSPLYAAEARNHTFIFTDRGLYKPGETVTFRGIDRKLRKGSYEPYTGGYRLELKNSRYGSPMIAETIGTCSESGGFYGTFDLTDDLEPGYYDIVYYRDNHEQHCRFQIAFFRRLNFQVKITKPNIEYYKNDTLNMKLAADYLSGGVMSGGKFNYFWVKDSTFYKPEGPNWQAYRFGPAEHDNPGTIDSGQGTLNNLGQFDLKHITKGTDKKGQAYRYTLNAQVEDIDRQVIQSRKSVTVHPASFYIGAKFAGGSEGWWSPFVTKGESFEAEYALVKPDGSVYDSIKKGTKLNVKLVNIEWKRVEQQGVYDRINTRYERVEVLEHEEDIEIKDSNGKFKIKTEKCGQYALIISGTDNFKRDAVTKINFYSTGSDWFAWGGQNVNDINLMADKNIYKPGESINLLVKSPLPKGKYLVTIEREGIFEEKIYDLEGAANLIKIPVKEEYIPVFYISIASYSVRDKEPPKSYTEPDLGKPKGYFGVTTVMVDTESKEIVLEIIPSQKSYQPGTESEVVIRATRDGKPLANTEITFLAVDRGVLDIINYHVPNPIDFFYDPSKFPLGVIGGDSRSLLIDPVTYETKDLHGGDGDSKLKKRKDFRPTAVFEPYLITNDRGLAGVKFKLPDTLTTYRCTAIALNGNNFGIEEDEIKVQNPINVRTALPRRMRIRDTSFAGVIVTNLDSNEHEVTVSIESDILTIEGESTRSVKMPANSKVEIPFKIVALEEGEATITFKTISDILKEELEVKLPVEKPIVKEAFTTIGETKAADGSDTLTKAVEGLMIPSNIGKGFGGVTVRMNSTRLTNLAESINYLYDYPYGCLEQRSSKLFPLVVFGDKVKPFIDEKNPKKLIEKELKYWGKFQNSDGGFPYWLKGDYPSGKFISIKIAKFLHYAKLHDITIPDSIDTNGLLNYISRFDKYTGTYVKLYSLYVQSLYGRNVLVKTNEIYDSKKEHSLNTYGFLGLIYHYNKEAGKANECFKKVKNLIKMGTQTIDIVDPAGYSRYYFGSQINDLSLILMLIDLIEPESHLITKAVNTLMQRQDNGYWGNTVTTEWVIQAFYELYKDEAGEKTDLTAKVTIDEKEFINTVFKGAVNDTYVKDLGFETDLKDIGRDNPVPLEFTTEGTGKLYYAATIRYALPFEVVLPRDEGLNVYSELQDLDGNTVKDTKYLKLGETYKMKVMVSSTRQWQYVAVRAPIPSGAEILDSSFATTAIAPPKQDKGNDYGYYSWWYKPLQFIYDNEVRYFFNYFPEGKKEMEFLFRVTTPGIFPTPPVMAECMYEEEVFGRTDGKLYIVMPK